MKNILFDDFVKTSYYENFMKTNSGSGMLKIRAYAASLALPVSDLEVIVSTVVGDMNVIFFDGKTDKSGMIDAIELPTPPLGNNLIVPNAITYKIVCGNNDFFVNMYDGICVVQNINYVPGDFNGS